MNSRISSWLPRLGVAFAVPLLAAALLPLALLQGPAAVQASDPPPQEAAVEVAAPDCSSSPLGNRVRLFGEDEIGMAGALSGTALLENIWADNSGQNLVKTGNWLGGGGSVLSNIAYPAIAMADLNGDGAKEQILAFRDSLQRIAVSIGSTYLQESWYHSSFVGDDVRWIDVAAGNLDRSEDGDEEIVLGFSNDAHAATVILLDGSRAAQIGNESDSMLGGYWGDTTNGRGEVQFLNVATGDLTGNGYDDDIIVAFKDGNADLQVWILRRDPILRFVWWKAWQDHDRGDVADDCPGSGYSNVHPIDVTTGDIDGDKQDEVILAFRSGPCYKGGGNVQLLVLDYRRGDGTGGYIMDDAVWTERKADRSGIYHEYLAAPTSISVSAADLDGDGYDEIAVGYTSVYVNAGNRWWQQFLLTYEYVPPLAPDYPVCQDDQGNLVACLLPRQGSWTGPAKQIPVLGSSVKPPAQVAIATGELDGDGKAEIVLAHREKDDAGGRTWLLSFDADAGLSLRGSLEIAAYYSMDEFALAMGDTNNDSRYGTYQVGCCREKTKAHLAAVLYVPPSWPEKNDSEATATYGASTTTISGTSTYAHSTMGGSVTLNYEVADVGPSFTYNWEKGAIVTSKHLTNTTSGEGFTTSAQGGLQLVEQRYWCYDYQEPQMGIMEVCIPEGGYVVSSYPLSWWYTTGINQFPDSWVPVGLNLAENMPAKQVSTWHDSVAGLAVDGVTDGNYYHGSVSHTGSGIYSWWQVDLGAVQWVDAVSVWNRADAFQSRLSDFYVFISDEDFPVNNPFTLATVYSQTVKAILVPGQCGRPTTVPVNYHGRYVRVQLGVKNYLHIAEVQVWGRPRGESPWVYPVSAPITSTSSITQAFELTWLNGRTQTVNGYLLYARQGSLIGVRAGGLPTNWQVGFGQQAEKVHEDTSAHGGSIGMKIGRVGGEYSHRHEDRHGYILSWSKDTSFSGQVSSTGLTTTTQQYNYAPYIWLQREWSRDGTEQAFLVLDYWVEPSPVTTTFGALPPGQLVTPALPLIASPSHPDAASWYEANMAIFTWVQPADDPAAVYGYAWSLDQTPDTIPQPLNQGLTTTCTYSDLPDGLWYLHVRPVSGNEQWGETAHRAVRIDADAPQVSLTLDPPLPTGNNGWYITPLTVSVNADDSGSGVATVQVSTDGATWQLYSAPLLFTSDTAPITLWARASDAAGHISPPVTCTFKIDSTPPTSHISGGQGPGAWVATVITNALGNSQLVLAGAIQDNLSGRAGLDLGFDNIDWTSASHIGSWYPIPDQPEIEVNWYYTATTQLGRGNHVFYGRAQDRAGNLEEAYELARVVWLPTDSPDLGGSSMAASPTTVRPGEVVTFDLVVRNGGYQEALVAVTDQLPEGLTLITEALGQHVGYDSTTGLVTWPERLLWPGQYVRYSFQARAAADLPATTLVNRATAHAFWPNTDSLPTEQRQVFLDHEQTVVVSAAVQVHPGLATGADVTPPWASLAVLTSPYKRVAEGPEVPLSIVAAADAQWMYLREWTTDRTTGAWTVAQSRGWLPYSAAYTWTLSPGQGVKYLGVWVADGAGNVSVLDESSLALVNRVDGVQALADGQRVQYRGVVERETAVIGFLTTVAGDPDIYVWRPFNAFMPDRYSNDELDPGQAETPGIEYVYDSGRYLLEVLAVGDSEYCLALEGQPPTVAFQTRLMAEKERPAHPLTISDPLSAAAVGTPDALSPYKIYLPVLTKNG